MPARPRLAVQKKQEGAQAGAAADGSSPPREWSLPGLRKEAARQVLRQLKRVGKAEVRHRKAQAAADGIFDGQDEAELLAKLEAECTTKWKPAAAPPTLIHQDLNRGNVLCSQRATQGVWFLDGLIDWESAAAGDARLAYASGSPWELSLIHI